jgi:hypothetical protein
MPNFEFPSIDLSPELNHSWVSMQLDQHGVGDGANGYISPGAPGTINSYVRIFVELSKKIIESASQ